MAALLPQLIKQLRVFLKAQFLRSFCFWQSSETMHCPQILRLLAQLCLIFRRLGANTQPYDKLSDLWNSSIFQY